jgi:hypothetical protein
MSLTNPMTPPGIDPGTVRLVTQRLNHYATPGPYYAASSDNLLPTFQDNLSVPPSWVKGLLTTENVPESLSRNVGKKLPLHAA